MHCVARRKRYLFVCVNRRPDGTPKGSCAQRGSVDLHAAFKEALVARGMWSTEVRACSSSCLDVCWAGPVVAVTPDDVFYGRVRLSDVDEIVDALARDERVERLVLPFEDFDMTTARASLPVQSESVSSVSGPSAPGRDGAQDPEGGATP
jgi:(2Fe-2S) ferredoxin